MRKDISKVLCETYKAGSPWVHGNRPRHKKNFATYFDEVGGKIGSGQYHKIAGVETKSFGENLNPLWRFIDKRVGKPWDETYSEICKVCKKSGAVSSHIFSHLFDPVVVQNKVVYQDGKPGYIRYGGWGEITWSEVGGYGEYYVDREGILRRGRKVKTYSAHSREQRDKNKKLMEQYRKIISRTVEYHYDETFKQWFRYELEPMPPKSVNTWVRHPSITAYDWWKLTPDQQKEKGLWTLTYPYVKSVLSKPGVVHPRASKGTREFYSSDSLPDGLYYYARKYQASKAEIKREGLVTPSTELPNWFKTK